MRAAILPAIGEKVEFGRLPGMFEQTDRLLDRRYVVVGRMQEQKRPRRDAAHDGFFAGIPRHYQQL